MQTSTSVGAERLNSDAAAGDRIASKARERKKLDFKKLARPGRSRDRIR